MFVTHNTCTHVICHLPSGNEERVRLVDSNIPSAKQLVDNQFFAQPPPDHVLEVVEGGFRGIGQSTELQGGVPKSKHKHYKHGPAWPGRALGQAGAGGFAGLPGGWFYMSAPRRLARLSLNGRPAPLTRPFYGWPHPGFLCVLKHRHGAGVYALSRAGSTTQKLIAMSHTVLGPVPGVGVMARRF
jgi:hypothetical protein